ncbi:hypothetical protein GNI_149820 [Gregarina niphandrodes]|uniref:Thioredoxin domain-containing protein n=1 Tax=Gregarina niphandrodes TaxID=110365 RepID=A0A023AZK5_GRENI|nr:hypothetical protein GNI_149820 [Gregarina niphandrodes]EZG44251.1 hypothetical protein GNI_149820 [Gregarina niphandrodes]|eukprot:XP_011132744.1 hypothetical protein GNI_149820 [Gregarina niphandrodes]
MRFSSGLLLFCADQVVGLSYVSNRKLESLVVNDANLVLIKTQDCNELCDMYEKSLDLIREGFESGEGVGKGIEDLKKVKFFKTEISANEKEPFQKKFGLARLPTTLLIRGPWIYDYSGDLVKEKVVDFVHKYMADIMVKFEKEKEAREFLNKELEPSDVHILIETDEAGRQNFEMIAGAEREFAKYGYLDSGAKYGEGKGSLTVMKWGMKSPLVIGGLDFTDHNKVFKTILEHQIPSITALDIPKMRYFFMQAKGFAWVIATEEEFNEALASEMKGLDSSRGLHFILVDPTKDQQFLAFINEVLKIKDREMHIIVTDVDGPGRYTFNGPWKRKDIEKFLTGALEGRLEREIQAEPVPTDDQDRLTMLTRTGDRRPLPLPKISSSELASNVARQHDSEWVVVVPSMLCQEHVCESVLQTLKQYSEEYNLTNLSQTQCIKIVMIDGHHNEFYPEWNFPIANSPPAWFIPKRTAGTTVQNFNKSELKLEQLDTLEHFKEFLNQNSNCTALPHADKPKVDKLDADYSKPKAEEL